MHIEPGITTNEKLSSEDSILLHSEQKGAKVIYLKTYCAKQMNDATQKALITTPKRKYNPLLFLWNWAHNFMSTVAHMLH